jgi:hypothetical protein
MSSMRNEQKRISGIGVVEALERLAGDRVDCTHLQIDISNEIYQ